MGSDLRGCADSAYLPTCVDGLLRVTCRGILTCGGLAHCHLGCRVGAKDCAGGHRLRTGAPSCKLRSTPELCATVLIPQSCARTLQDAREFLSGLLRVTGMPEMAAFFLRSDNSPAGAVIRACGVPRAQEECWGLSNSPVLRNSLL